MNAFHLVLAVDGPQPTHLATAVDRADHRAEDASVPMAFGGSLGGGGEDEQLPAEWARVAEGERRALELAEIESEHAAQLPRGQRPISQQGVEDLRELERDDEVCALLAVPALEQPELVAHDRRALHVQPLHVLSQQRVERREVQLQRLAIERAIRSEPPREAPVALRCGARAEAEQRTVRM